MVVVVAVVADVVVVVVVVADVVGVADMGTEVAEWKTRAWTSPSLCLSRH